MARTERQPKRSGEGHGSANMIQRQKQISMACSKLLRHQAQNEKVLIDAQGWVNMEDLLMWRTLKDKQRFNPAVTLQEILDVVEHDGRHGKGRFGLRSSPVDSSGSRALKSSGPVDEATVESVVQNTQNLRLSDLPAASTYLPDPDSKNSIETQQAIFQFTQNPDVPLASFWIRATQGHSIKVVESEGLLQQLTLGDPESLPNTIVHGTFYGAWDAILASGGLSPMGRNNVHFATGPSVKRALAKSSNGLSEGHGIDEDLGHNKVISGMRSDAQLLIYVDLRRCLQHVKDQGLEMRWYKSDNGVILTEGVSQNPPQEAKIPELTTIHHDDPDRTNKRTRGKPQNGSTQRLVPVEYWEMVIEVKAGLGVIWRRGEGLVQDLPQDLKAKPLPRGKTGHHGKQAASRGNKTGRPALKFERNDQDIESAG